MPIGRQTHWYHAREHLGSHPHLLGHAADAGRRGQEPIRARRLARRARAPGRLRYRRQRALCGGAEARTKRPARTARQHHTERPASRPTWRRTLASLPPRRHRHAAMRAGSAVFRCRGGSPKSASTLRLPTSAALLACCAAARCESWHRRPRGEGRSRATFATPRPASRRNWRRSPMACLPATARWAAAARCPARLGDH